jgi:acyl carrier protein
MREKIKKFVINYIEKRGKLPENINLDEFNYIETGYVDSMGIIKFIVELEKEFDIEIKDDDMLSPKFKTIGGLIELIEGKINSL